jgi:SAM-dependent methyltransferase
MSFQESQDQEYLDLCKARLESPINLIWTTQAVDILSIPGINSINDIGCNVGQFYKATQMNGSGCWLRNVDYTGIDSDECYLDIARSVYPYQEEPLRQFLQLDITKNSLPMRTDATVCSATLEHLERPLESLDYLLRNTLKVMVLRTFLGEMPLKAIRFKPKAQKPYVIHQFSFMEILDLFSQNGFETEVIRDKATDSMPKYLDQGIVRTQYFIVGKRPKTQ